MGGAISTGNNFFNFNLNLNLFGNGCVQPNAAQAMGAINLLNQFFGQDAMSMGGQSGYQHCIPQCGCMPTPTLNQAGPPAGQGLTQNEDGSVTTAGGYRIDATGKSSEWKIYGPDGDQLTRVWGDPHVDESDGTRWDFTKDSDFVLPDGTRIFADTNYDPSKGNGQSVTTGLTIANGADKATITGVNTGSPKTSMSQDGYEWRAAHLASNPNRDSFHMTATGKDDVHWIRERNGQIDGVIQQGRGHKVSAGNHKIYDQKVSMEALNSLPPGHRPPVGSQAWGNMLRGQMNDAQAKLWGQALGPMGAWPAVQTAFGIHGNHIEAQFQSELQNLLFGGLPGYFGGFNSPMNALGGLIDLLRSDGDWRRQLHGATQMQHMAHLC